MIIRRAYGLHSPEAALTTVMLACGPVNLELPEYVVATTCGVESSREYLLRTFERAYPSTQFQLPATAPVSAGRFSMRFDDILGKRMGGVAAIRPPLPLNGTARDP